MSLGRVGSFGVNVVSAILKFSKFPNFHKFSIACASFRFELCSFFSIFTPYTYNEV